MSIAGGGRDGGRTVISEMLLHRAVGHSEELRLSVELDCPTDLTNQCLIFERNQSPCMREISVLADFVSVIPEMTLEKPEMVSTPDPVLFLKITDEH